MSLKSNDLRVGNYVKGIGHKISWLVEGIESEYIYSSKSWRLINCSAVVIRNRQITSRTRKYLTTDQIDRLDAVGGVDDGISHEGLLKLFRTRTKSLSAT